MNSCPNCKAPISCSCQIRTASNGRQVCSACIVAYEQSLQASQSLVIDHGPYVNATLTQ